MFGNNELPKELKDLGLSPAQIIERLNSAKTLEDKVKAQDSELGTLRQTVEASTNNYNELKTKLDSIEANTPIARPDPNTPPAKTSFLEDEDKAFNQRFNEGVGPVAFAAANANAKAAKMLAKSMLVNETIKTSTGVISLSRLWDRWIADIDKEAKLVQLPYLGDENTWLRIFNLVKANHLEELMSKPETFIEPVSTGVNVRVGDAPVPDKLDDAQAAIVNKMARYGKGVTAERVMEARKKMNFVGDNA